MKTKEEVLDFLLTSRMSLSQYDYKFFSNIKMMIHNKQQVTTNQALLFSSLISKYKKQLKKHGYDHEVLRDLTWETPIVQTKSEYTSVRISIVDNNIEVKLPFNKTFVENFRHEYIYNPFRWIREEKRYLAPFSTRNLKLIIDATSKYFDDIRFCDEIMSLIRGTQSIGKNVRYWNPTLIESNGNLMVVACNNIIGEIIKDIELNLNGDTLSKLASYGIIIDLKLLQTPEQKFATSIISTVDISEVDVACQWLCDHGYTHVILDILQPRFSDSSFNRGIQEAITNANLNVVDMNLDESFDKKKLKNVVLISGISSRYHLSNFQERWGKEVSKVLIIKDSTPVEIK